MPFVFHLLLFVLEDSMQSDALVSAVGKARRHLIPFIMPMYILTFLDRANIGFAKMSTNWIRALVMPFSHWARASSLSATRYLKCRAICSCTATGRVSGCSGSCSPGGLRRLSAAYSGSASSCRVREKHVPDRPDRHQAPHPKGSRVRTAVRFWHDPCILSQEPYP